MPSGIRTRERQTLSDMLNLTRVGDPHPDPATPNRAACALLLFYSSSVASRIEL
jgi:hypothetical protein